jgi:uncharacterized protein (TIGR04255 family)
MESIKSYSTENAIKVLAFAINLEQRLSSEQIDFLVKKVEEVEYFKNNFSNKQIQEEISIITQDGITTQTKGVAGIVWQKIDKFNKPLWTLTINKETIVIACHAYTRWNEISKQAFEYINNAFKLISDIPNITQITLEYLDEFEVVNIYSNWKKELFKDNCEYITSNIHNLNDFWHISQGYFIKLEEQDEKLLDTVDIHYFSDELDNLKHKINIRIQHKLLYSPKTLYNQEAINNSFEKIHKHSKKIFIDIINDDIINQFNTGEN